MWGYQNSPATEPVPGVIMCCLSGLCAMATSFTGIPNLTGMIDVTFIISVGTSESR